MSCQARKKKVPVFFGATRLPCEQPGKLTSARELITGQHAARVSGASPAPTGPSRPAPRAPRPRPGRPAPPRHPVPIAKEQRPEHFNQRRPSLPLPALGPSRPRGGWGQELGTQEGEKPVRVPSPYCVTLESFPALSGRGCRKWKCEANQTRCDYF